MYTIIFSKDARKDLDLIKKSAYKATAYKLLDILENDPYYPPYEALVGDFKGTYSRRINIKHRLVYKIDDQTKTVTIIGMWGHYDDN